MINHTEVHDLCEILAYQVTFQNRAIAVAFQIDCERHSGGQCKAVTDVQGLGAC